MQMNRIELAGYLGGDPLARFLGSGTKVVTLRMAETYRYTDRDQKEHEHTNWHNLVFYGPLADIAETFKKGENVFVEGTMQVRQYTPADGHRRTHYEVVVRTTHSIGKPRIANVPDVPHTTTPSEPIEGVQADAHTEDFYAGRA